ncbi:hypothetical protein Pint_27203 [Pistacia integerrima]|uniref:Uncharacterized protein n=1 Tax=Pistacia integerrima TaxID=434235 RepID=A0ACC0YR73_9ROSI|nr:hypothetical protein Pint_27203 [Pistacia integerrima]
MIWGYTAFVIAAINGFKDMVEAMFIRDENLINIKEKHGLIPIVAASVACSTKVVRYLYPKTPDEMLSPEHPDRSGATLLNCLIVDDIYDLALHLLGRNPQLAFVEGSLWKLCYYITGSENFCIPKWKQLCVLETMDLLTGSQEVTWASLEIVDMDLEMRSMLPPKYMEEVNESNKTPSELFTEKHQILVQEGERWMKNTAASCMVVATLIAAVMFTTAYTVPGGNDEKEGTPIFLNKDVFLIFVLSDALSLLSSCISVLVFLGILTSRYAEKDFWKSLPTKLIIGLSSLFFSIVTMMASFGAAIVLILQDRLHWVSVPIIVLSSIPIALYSFLPISPSH